MTAFTFTSGAPRPDGTGRGSRHFLRLAVPVLAALVMTSTAWADGTSPQPVGQLDDASKLTVERARAQMLFMKLGGTGFEAPQVGIPTTSGGCQIQVGMPASSQPGARGLLADRSNTFVLAPTICLTR